MQRTFIALGTAALLVLGALAAPARAQPHPGVRHDRRTHVIVVPPPHFARPWHGPRHLHRPPPYHHPHRHPRHHGHGHHGHHGHPVHRR